MKKLCFLLLLFLFPKLCFGAIHADTVWECRADATAGNVNGGGFNASNAAPGTDRSLNETAHDSGTDLTCADGDVDGCVIASASHNFVADDQGNIIHITETGDGFTVGWYEIVSTAANEATLDRACGTDGAKTGGDWYLGGAMSLASTLDDEFFETAVAGNTIWLETGTYTKVEATSVDTNGTDASPIIMEGYKTSRGDNPTGTDRPLIACSTYQNQITGDYWQSYNLRFTTTTTNGIEWASAANRCIAVNCYAYNSSGSSNRRAFLVYQANEFRLINCEGISTNGYAYDPLTVNYHFMIGNYLHDSNYGIYIGSGNYHFMMGNIIDTCTTAGIELGAQSGMAIYNNTIYNCGIGINGTSGSRNVVINNIIDGCTTGVKWTTANATNWLDYNVWDNTTDTSGVTWGDNRVEGDPGMTAPADGDFTLGSGSNAIDAGLKLTTDQGVAVDCKYNIGADQDDVTAAGAGGGAFGWWGRQ